MHFLKHLGLTNPHLPNLFSFPRLLSANVGETLQPNLQLLELGFTNNELQLLIQSNPFVFLNPLAMSSLQFWKKFLSTSRKKINVLSLTLAIDIVSGIGPKIAPLKQSSYSDIENCSHCQKSFCFIALVSILRGLVSLNRIEWDAFDVKREFFKGFGWSDAQLLAALGEFPDFIHLPEEIV